MEGKSGGQEAVGGEVRSREGLATEKVLGAS